MDPDSGGYFTGSNLVKTSLLTISFSAFYFYRTENQSPTLRISMATEDSVLSEKPVKVLPKKKKKTIYLTFDDGPNKGTRKLIEICKQENIPVTMFLVGEHVYGSKEQSELYDSLSSNQLFEIANHSYTHANGNHYQQFYELPDSVVSDFKRCADSLGLSSNIIRTPGRNIWRTENISTTDIRSSKTAADSLHANGFTAMGWDLEWHFTNDQHLVQSDSLMHSQIDSAFSNNRTKTKGKLVLLAHDRSFYSSNDSAALHRFIIRLKESDEYDFDKVSGYNN
jgi:peptidoglycan-N-acetylglucosamine deacetylase